MGLFNCRPVSTERSGSGTFWKWSQLGLVLMVSSVVALRAMVIASSIVGPIGSKQLRHFAHKMHLGF